MQDVADAAALAAENQVAEFMLIARTCDAVVLTMSLSGIVTTGLGVAALCTPATARFSEQLIDAGTKLLDARNVFSQRAKTVLSQLQEALPFFAAANAAGIAIANDGAVNGADYVAAAVLVPWDGVSIEIEEMLHNGNARLSTRIANRVNLLKRNIFSLKIRNIPGTNSNVSSMADLIA